MPPALPSSPFLLLRLIVLAAVFARWSRSKASTSACCWARRAPSTHTGGTTQVGVHNTPAAPRPFAQGGTTINAIQRDSGAVLDMQKKADEGSSLQAVTLRGNTLQVRKDRSVLSAVAAVSGLPILPPPPPPPRTHRKSSMLCAGHAAFATFHG